MDYHRHNNFTVRVGLEFDTGANAGTQRNMIIYFAVNAEDNLSIFADQGLSTGV
jgi:hypothetical protein